MKRKSIIIIAALVLIGLTIFGVTQVTSQSQPRYYTVKLYSGDRVVATWQALDWGKIDDQTFIFSVGDRKYPKRVRIVGTFSVEEGEFN